jgi:uncharacterized membrane protein YfcA
MDETSKFSSAAVSLFIAILSGLGVGSGGLFVVWLTMVEGVDAIGARGLNLLFFVFSATSALLFHLIRKRIRVQTVLILSLFGAAGTLVGSLIGDSINPFILKKIFGAMLFLSGLRSLLGKAKQNISIKDRKLSRLFH